MAPQATSIASALFFLYIRTATSSQYDQRPLHFSNDPQSPSWAIIGLGITGASTAYHLRKTLGAESPSITIFEAESHLGGRISTIYPVDNEHQAFEAGALHFYPDDWCLRNTINDLGLLTRERWPRHKIWNGHKYLEDPVCHAEDPPLPQRPWTPIAIQELVIWYLDWLWLSTKMLWGYGRSLWKFRDVVALDQRKWESLARSQPFTNVRSEIGRVGLEDAVHSAHRYYGSLGIDPGFLSTHVEPCISSASRYGMNASGLATFLSVGGTTPQTLRLDKGNIHLIEKMIEFSGADVKLSTQVNSVTRLENGAYRLSVTGKHNTIQDTDFDAVFLAAPLDQTLASSFNFDVQSTPPQSADAHVTLFATLNELNLPSDDPPPAAWPPQDILFSSPSTLLSINVFYKSLSDPSLCSTDVLCDERDDVHRIVSTQRLSDNDILSLFGETSTKHGKKPMLDPGHIRVLERHVWPNAYSYYENTSDWSGEIELAPKLWHLGAAEGVLSTLEMGCRMGRNGAMLARDSRDTMNQTGRMRVDTVMDEVGGIM